MSRPPSLRTRILDALTDEPMSTLQLAARAGITARRRGEVVRLACAVLEDEGLIERIDGRGHPKWRRPKRSTAGVAPSRDECLARELVQGLAQSAVARGVDPVGRLQEFRTLQQATIAMSRDPAVVQAAEQIVRAIDSTLQEFAAVKS